MCHTALKPVHRLNQVEVLHDNLSAGYAEVEKLLDQPVDHGGGAAEKDVPAPNITCHTVPDGFGRDPALL